MSHAQHANTTVHVDTARVCTQPSSGFPRSGKKGRLLRPFLSSFSAASTSSTLLRMSSSPFRDASERGLLDCVSVRSRPDDGWLHMFLSSPSSSCFSPCLSAVVGTHGTFLNMLGCVFVEDLTERERENLYPGVGGFVFCRFVGNS